MKAGWEVRPLGQVTIVDWGNTHLTKKAFVEGGEFLGVSAAGCDGRMAHAEHKRQTPVLSAIGANCGRMFLPDEDFTAIKNTITITPRENAFDRVFLFYLLTMVDLPQRGAGQPFISKGDIQKFVVPIPPIEEQKRIVAVLDAAFEGLTRAKENAEANLQNARKLFEAGLDKCLVQDAQDWPEYQLSALGKLTTGGTPKSGDTDQYGDALPFIKPGHFQTDGSLEYDDIGLSDAGAAGARIIPENSAVMVCIGATIGKSGYSDKPIATNQQINALSPNEGLHHYFAYLNFITPTFQKQVISNSGQATLPIINKTKWGKLKIRVPIDLSVQQAIVDRMTEVRAQVDLAAQNYRTKLTDISDLRQSLLQKAFAGELT